MYCNFVVVSKLEQINPKDYLDPVMLSLGMEVYTNEYAQILRKQVLEDKRKGRRSYTIIPQEGFQEKVLTNQADIEIIGGKRGSGKSAVSVMGAGYYAYNPDANLYGFRRYEDDVKRGLWKTCTQLMRGLGSFANTEREFKFFNGVGATFKMEHLADLSKVKDRFRGAEMPYIVIEELAELTRDDLNVIFDLIGSNRSTAGVRPRFICTCNPVGRSNKLRWFLDWWIDPETDMAIPERSGKIRYFCRYGEDVMEIAWGDTPEEVYAHPAAHTKICSLTENPDEEYVNFITSLTFIDGDFAENKILHVADPKYMNKISAGGARSTVNDIRGIWRDVDDSDCLVNMQQMQSFFANRPQANGRRCAAGDIALINDLIVLFAADGYHVIDCEARAGIGSDEVIPFILEFLRRNDVPIENFVYDVNGIGNWLRASDALAKAVPFDNKAPAIDKLAYSSLKSEMMGLLVEDIIRGKMSIEESVLQYKTFQKGEYVTMEQGLIEERLMLRWAKEDNPKQIIQKKDMKQAIGHSPDRMEALLYLRYAMSRVNAASKTKIRKGNWDFFSN